eukprot:scaffold84564_cov32-Tisochrysis_lutea.AAC.2
MIQAYGPEHAAENFAAFDTICDATQVRRGGCRAPRAARCTAHPKVLGNRSAATSALTRGIAQRPV